MTKDLEYYMSLPYKIVVEPDPVDGGFVMHCPELPGCISQADREEDIMPMIRDAMKSWISCCLKYGDPIPKPQQEERITA